MTSTPCVSLADSNETLTACVQALGMPYLSRHLFLCADQTVPKCCDRDQSLASWNYLKNRLKELKLDVPQQPNLPDAQESSDLQASCIFRTKANCLRVCQQGPILVVYPDGVWYHSATPEVIEQIIQQHLLANQIVSDYAFLIHPLTATTPKQVATGEGKE